jgi:hypothetical protein
MAVRRPTYLVELDDGSEHRVEVLMADQLRAELEAPRHSIPVDVASAPVHTTALWVWSALLRTGVLESGTGFQAARSRLTLVRKLDPDTEPAEPDAPVDPTQQGQPAEPR